jgi:hypothetical protein
MSRVRFVVPPLALALAVLLGARLHAAPIPPIHDLAAIEFVDAPPTGLVVSGGLLGVTDSAGTFPTPYRRVDVPTGNFADPGRVAGDALVFTNLRPGRYRLAMVFLSESKLARRVLPNKGRKPIEDHCLVYGDSLESISFTIADGEFRYLGRVVRRSMPTLESQERLWRTGLEWVAGDERKVVKSLGKHKDLGPWRDLLEARQVAIDSDTTRGR